ncbi:MAG: nucleotide-binding domain containing protein, partial [Betaproteobacteria bacterium]
STRALAQAMAAAAGGVIRQASTLVLTGGDTARTVLDHLGIERLDVLGEVEPGICVSRGSRPNTPCVVTKAGGFGDKGALLRVVRQFEALRVANRIIGEKA